MKRVTHTRILALAISRLTEMTEEGNRSVEEWEAMGRHTEACWFYDHIVGPDEEELRTLKTLYEVETGTPYEMED